MLIIPSLLWPAHFIFATKEFIKSSDWLPFRRGTLVVVVISLLRRAQLFLLKGSLNLGGGFDDQRDGFLCTSFALHVMNCSFPLREKCELAGVADLASALVCKRQCGHRELGWSSDQLDGLSAYELPE